MPDEPAGPVPTTLQVSLSASSVDAGRTVTATATALDQHGAPIALPALTWSTSHPEIATVDAQGGVIAAGPGDVAIVATSGNLTATAPLTVAAAALGACRLPGPQFGVGLGFPRINGRARSTGDVRVTVLFVDFSDAVATRTPESVFSIISPGAEQYYDAVSYGRMHLSFDPHFAWLHMSKPTNEYSWDALTFDLHKAYIQEAVDLAGPGLDVSASESILVVANPDATGIPFGPTLVANPGDGVVAGGKRFDNAVTSGHDLLFWGSYWFNHEFGHAMSLVDLYDFAVPTNPEQFHFVGDFSMMGNIAGLGREYLGWERWLLGWVADDQVLCAEKGHTAAMLTPVEAAGGKKLVVVPTGATTAVVVENRRNAGYDSALPNQGLLVYFIDTSIDTGNGVVKVLPVADSDLRKLTAPLAVGQSLTFAQVTVAFTSHDAAGDRVDVMY
jgi:M6 family metalloprotease-like protein